MVWSSWKDELLLREVLLLELYQYKPRSRERGNSWKIISDHLNAVSNDDVYFKVDARAVRERFDLLVAQYLCKQKDEEKASGINPEPSSVDIALESVLERIKICEEEQNQNDKENNDKTAQDRKNAEDMRKKSMETFMETKARKKIEGDEAPPGKRRRSSGSDTIQYLRDKAEADRDVRLQELELQRNELKFRQDQQNQMMQNMVQQNQQILGIVAKLLQQK